MTPEEFYQKRDNRTELCVGPGDYQRRSCEVAVSPSVANTHGGQVATIVACDLLSRWCRRVVLQIPKVPLVQQLAWLGDQNLALTALERMSNSDPYADFTLDSNHVCDFALVIGTAPAAAEITNATFVTGSNWIVAVSDDVPQSDETSSLNPLTASIASALGVARVFMKAARISGPLDRTAVLNCFDMSTGLDGWNPSYPENTDIGSLLCVGAGAVASSSLYCLALAGVKARTAVVDGDALEVENIGRQPTATLALAEAGTAKALALADALRGSSVSAEGYPNWWDEFTAAHGHLLSDFDVWLPLANEREVRRSIQANSPPVLVHASTSRDWMCSFGRHIPNSGDCLVERFPENTGSSNLRCSSAPIPGDGEKPIDASLPFLSLLAGALVASDLVRLTMSGYPHTQNMINIDLRGVDFRPQCLHRASDAACPHCRHPIASSLRAKTKYGHLLVARDELSGKEF